MKISPAYRTSPLLAALLLLPLPAAAQLRAAAAPNAMIAAQAPRSGLHRFAIEAAGGIAGSAAGVGIGLLLVRPDRCDGDDIVCILERLGSIGIVTALTSPAGTVLLGRAFDTEPHVLGALLGGILGVGAGVGALRILDQAGAPAEGASAVVIYTVAQGLTSAVGSRVFGGRR